MKKLVKLGAISFALGFVFIGAETANGQSTRREARREYRGEVREARQDRRSDIRDSRRDYRNDIRSGEKRRAALREYRNEVRGANREYRSERRESYRDYRQDIRRTNNRSYRSYNNRRPDYRSSQYYYRNGRLFRRY